MLKLTFEHIEQIRKYFLATEDEEKTILHKNITPNFLGGFLNDLNQLFIYKPTDEERLVSFGKVMGAGEHIETLRQIQSDYYSHLAGIYIKGGTNSDIELMLKINNPVFAEEVAYQRNLKVSFLSKGREEFKKKFQDIDGEDEISNSELNRAFRQSERSRLKRKFKEIDQSQYEYLSESDSISLVALAYPASEYGLINSVNDENNTQIENIDLTSRSELQSLEKRDQLPNRGNFDWRRFAVAASIIALIAVAGLFVIRSEKQNKEIADKQLDGKNLKESEFKELMSTNQLAYDEVKIKVLKEQSLGFAVKDEEIKVRLYVLSKVVDTLEKILINTKEKEAPGNGPTSGLIRNYIDSLKSLTNTYTFGTGVLSIYLDSAATIKLYQVADNYFVEINNSIYYANKATTSSLLKKVSENDVLEKIERIDFNAPNQ